MTASANIPDGFSMGELELLAQAAAHRENADANTDGECDCENEPLFDGKTVDEVTEIAQSMLRLPLEECNDPMVHKIMALEIISNMIEWHTKQGIEDMEQGNHQSAVAWTRDAGKFQAALGIILSVGCGPNDWTLPNI